MELFKRSTMVAATLCAGLALSACETPGDRDAPEPAGRSPAGDPGRTLPPGPPEGAEGAGGAGNYGTGAEGETTPVR